MCHVSCVMCCVSWVKRWAGIDGNTIKNDGSNIRDGDDNGRMADEREVAQLEIDRAQAHGLGFQNLKPEPKALASHALGLGLAGLSRASWGQLWASSPNLHITTANMLNGDSRVVPVLHVLNGHLLGLSWIELASSQSILHFEQSHLMFWSRNMVPLISAQSSHILLL